MYLCGPTDCTAVCERSEIVWTNTLYCSVRAVWVCVDQPIVLQCASGLSLYGPTDCTAVCELSEIVWINRLYCSVRAVWVCVEQQNLLQCASGLSLCGPTDCTAVCERSEFVWTNRMYNWAEQCGWARRQRLGGQSETGFVGGPFVIIMRSLV
jgi:hypothetical protein